MNYASNYGLGNLQSSLGYLNQMSFPPGIQKDFLMLSSMYNSTYNNMLGSGSSSSRSGGSVTNSPFPGVGGYNIPPNYGMLFNQNSGGSSMMNPSSNLPTSASPYPTSSAMANLYSSSTLGAATGNTSPYGAAANLMNPNLSVPTTSGSSVLSSLLAPFSDLSSAAPTLTSVSSSANSSSNAITSTTTSTMSSIPYSSNMQNEFARMIEMKAKERSSNTPSPSLPISNSMRGNTTPGLSPILKDGFSIPTSVITKASNAQGPLPRDLSKNAPSVMNRNSPTIYQNSPGGAIASRSSPGIQSNYNRDGTTISVTKGATRNNLMSMNTNRNSPSLSGAPGLRPTSSSSSHSPTTITVGGDRGSPEPHIIVKNVNAINQSIDKPAAKQSTASNTPIKNINMGIVYPKAADNTKFDLSHNEGILKKVQSHINQMTLKNNNSTIQTAKNQLDLISNSKSMQPQSLPSTRTAPHQTLNQRAKLQKSMPNATSVSAELIRRSKDNITTTPNKPNITNMISSDVTISPSNRKLVNASGVTISPVSSNKKPAVSYSRTPTATANRPIKVLTPQQAKQQQHHLAARSLNPKLDEIKITHVQSPSSNAIAGSSPLATLKRIPGATGT